MQRGDKQGQFYLVAAIVIAGILIGSISVINYSQKGKSVLVDEMKEELQIETQNVLDYGERNSVPGQIRSFGQNYSDYRKEADIYFIYGENSSLEAYKYSGGSEEDFSSNIAIESDKIKFSLENDVYEFNLEEGENFYFIISQKIKGDEYVSVG